MIALYSDSLGARHISLAIGYKHLCTASNKSPARKGMAMQAGRLYNESANAKAER